MTKRNSELEAADFSSGKDYTTVNTAMVDVDAVDMMTIENVIVLSNVDTAVATLTASGIITETGSGHRPLFRDGHLEHLAREYAALGKQRAWDLYRDDLTVVSAFYAEEFDKMVCEAAQ